MRAKSMSVLIAAALLITGCGKKKQQSGADKSPAGKFVIGVSLLTRTHPFYQDLEAGLNQAAKENGYELVVTSGEFDVAKQKDQAFRTAEDILQAHPDLDGIFGINDDSALGALAAVEKAGKSGRVTIVGFVAVPEARQAIKDGKIYADVIQKPTEIGRKTIEAVKTYVSGGQTQPAILIPCGLFTQQDALAMK